MSRALGVEVVAVASAATIAATIAVKNRLEVRDMQNYLERLKEDLQETADWQEMITVRRADLERLIQVYEKLKEEQNGQN